MDLYYFRCFNLFEQPSRHHDGMDDEPTQSLTLFLVGTVQSVLRKIRHISRDWSDHGIIFLFNAGKFVVVVVCHLNI